VHVAIDDATRLAYVEVLPDEMKATTVGFLARAVEGQAVHPDPLPGMGLWHTLPDLRGAEALAYSLSEAL
jgi:hypothetical protein